MLCNIGGAGVDLAFCQGGGGGVDQNNFQKSHRFTILLFFFFHLVARGGGGGFKPPKHPPPPRSAPEGPAMSGVSIRPKKDVVMPFATDTKILKSTVGF